MTRETTAAMGSGRSITRPRASPAMAWGAGRGRSGEQERRPHHAGGRPDAGRLSLPTRFIPGFRGSPTAVLHRFGTDPEYASWLKRFYRSNGNGQSNVPASRRDDSVSGRIQALKDQTEPERRLRERGTASQRSMNGLECQHLRAEYACPCLAPA